MVCACGLHVYRCPDRAVQARVIFVLALFAILSRLAGVDWWEVCFLLGLVVPSCYTGVKRYRYSGRRSMWGEGSYM